jgi:methionine sulfoxide reductase heme-binding subunit
LNARGLVAAKAAIHALCLAPLAWVVADVVRDTLGPDPVAQITHRTGIWAFRLLLVTLAVTPLRRATGRAELVKLRRMLGLWAFAYASLHFATYLVLDLGGYWPQIFEDLVDRPYITVGFLAWLLLVPLAATSTRGMMRRLGRNWLRLHRVVYAIGVLVALHFIWLVKSGEEIARREPLVYAGLLALLLLARLLPALAARLRTRPVPSAPRA